MMFDTRLTIPEASARSAGKALRAFGWSELAARINAARDLRRVLREDRGLLVASFEDAAAGYFAQGQYGEPRVNLGALEGRKSRCGKRFSAEGEAETGDREK